MDRKTGRFLRRFADYPACGNHLVSQNLQGRPLLYVPARHRAAEQTLLGPVHHPYVLSVVGELPLALYGRLEVRRPRPVAGSDRFGQDTSFTSYLAATVLGHERRRLHARHQQSRRAEDPLHRQQPRPAKHLRSRPGAVQLPHRASHQPEGQTQVVHHHRRASHHLFLAWTT